MMNVGMKEKAEAYLRKALNNPSLEFRDGQWESISCLLNRKRVLVVQRTGWGKSMVYFLATRLLRDQGAGPTLLISPLLSLMRNQLEAAQRIGLNARTVNSTNQEEWDHIQSELIANQVDILLISPERLSNGNFLQEILAKISSNLGLFVVDEAHCISDWGHEFRPDYRRIVRVLKAIPSNIPVLATTATANDRVINDIQTQLGQKLMIQRGTLVRSSLKLQNIIMPGAPARLAWLAQTIPALPGSGIVYTLTKRDADRVAEWLRLNNINACAYHADIADREVLEEKLLNNEIKVLVATIALGMGFDKPDLGFVIHYQRPGSVVQYYQQVGRAGRAIDNAYGILLCGVEDDRITDFFIHNAFPPQQHISAILQVLDHSNNGLSSLEIQKLLNLPGDQLTKTLKFLSIESPSPIVKVNSKWHVTSTATNYKVDQSYIDAITAVRRQEQTQMRNYMKYTGCLMSFLQEALNDPLPVACGKCKNCSPDLLLKEDYDEDLAKRAKLFLCHNYQRIKPRKRWPAKNILSNSSINGYDIPNNLMAEEGRALSLWRDDGWGELVAQGKYNTEHFSDDLVTACVDMIKIWAPISAPQWVTCIPSLKHPNLVPDFAARLANALGLPFIPCIKKIVDNQQQKLMENSYQQVKNLDGVFDIHPTPQIHQPCLLIDDIINSRWTMTVAAALLRQHGCCAVYPLALALNSPKMD